MTNNAIIALKVNSYGIESGRKKYRFYIFNKQYATVRLIKGLPSRFLAFVKRKIKEYRSRPKRKDISRVYVVVGYTTKKRVDEKFNAERRMMIIRRGLLILIFILVLLIAVDRLTGAINYGELSQIFGIEEWGQVVENDPFADRTTESTPPVITESGNS